jgi:selenocysteine lyase/cysteine desulfurase
VEHLRVLDRGRELCAIVSVAVDNRDPRQLVAALRQQRINASAQIREYAVLDYDDKGVNASLRLSPHYYNTEEEIDVAVSALRQLLT